MLTLTESPRLQTPGGTRDNEYRRLGVGVVFAFFHQMKKESGTSQVGVPGRESLGMLFTSSFLQSCLVHVRRRDTQSLRSGVCTWIFVL